MYLYKKLFNTDTEYSPRICHGTREFLFFNTFADFLVVTVCSCRNPPPLLGTRPDNHARHSSLAVHFWAKASDEKQNNTGSLRLSERMPSLVKPGFAMDVFYTFPRALSLLGPLETRHAVRRVPCKKIIISRSALHWLCIGLGGFETVAWPGVEGWLALAGNSAMQRCVTATGFFFQGLHAVFWPAHGRHGGRRTMAHTIGRH